MLRESVQLIDEAVDEGFERGLTLFMENLESDMAKSEMLAENGGLDRVMAEMLTSDGIEVEILEEELDETKIDAMLEEFKKEGIL